MNPLAFSPASLEDINYIWDYTSERWGIEQAESYIDDIQAACESLASGSKRGRDAEVPGGYLKYLVGSHAIFFRKSGNALVIIRVLHQRMIPEKHL